MYDVFLLFFLLNKLLEIYSFFTYDYNYLDLEF